jgi:hypothetical protein
LKIDSTGRDFYQWTTEIKFLVGALGPSAGHLSKEPIHGNKNWSEHRDHLVGMLRGLRSSIENGLLLRIEDRVLADAFGNLLDEADYLLTQNHLLAAGVLGRAVLEEHLRKLCQQHGCMPTGRPTINDLNMALYPKHLAKLAMQDATALATAGNHCAHNNDPPLSKDDVTWLLRGVRDFLVRNPS